MLIIGIQTVLPQESEPGLSGGQGEDLSGLEGMDVVVSRIDVVHRIDKNDPSTESVMTVFDDEQTLNVLADLSVTKPRQYTFLNVPKGFVYQVRYIVKSAAIRVDGETHDVTIPSGAKTGVKVVPVDDEPFAIVAQERTAARILLEPFKQLIRNKGNGFMFKPVLKAEHLSLTGLSGIALDRVVVGFKPGVTPDQINDLNSGLGTTVISSWPATNYYVMRLPIGVTLEDALEYYVDEDIVDYTLPDTLIGELATPCTDVATYSVNFDVFNANGFPKAWDVTTGHHRVRVAVVDSGFDLNHRNLEDNWDINPFEVFGAPGFPFASEDCADRFAADRNNNQVFDSQDVLRFLESPDNGTPLCTFIDGGNGFDVNDLFDVGNGLADGFDQEFEILGTSIGGRQFVDDLVGWNFGLNSNRVQATGERARHGTAIAGIIGGSAVPGTTCDRSKHLVAGSSWNVRLLPITVDSTTPTFALEVNRFRSDVVRAINYAAQQRADVINVSLGFHMARGELTATERSRCQNGVVFENVGKKFQPLIEASEKEFRSLDLTADVGVPHQSLLVLAAGNCNIDTNPASTERWTLWQARSADQPVVVASSTRLGEEVTHGEDYVDIAALDGPLVVLGGNGGLSDRAYVGTSNAAALVSGAAALVIAGEPESFTGADGAIKLKKRLLCSAPEDDTLAGLVRDKKRLDAFAAVSTSCE